MLKSWRKKRKCAFHAFAVFIPQQIDHFWRKIIF